MTSLHPSLAGCQYEHASFVSLARFVLSLDLLSYLFLFHQQLLLANACVPLPLQQMLRASFAPSLDAVWLAAVNHSAQEHVVRKAGDSMVINPSLLPLGTIPSDTVSSMAPLQFRHLHT